MIKRRMTEKEGRRENWFIYAFVALLVLMMALALYGYLSGAWETTPL
jgi:hypothetical protein